MTPELKQNLESQSLEELKESYKQLDQDLLSTLKGTMRSMRRMGSAKKPVKVGEYMKEALVGFDLAASIVLTQFHIADHMVAAHTYDFIIMRDIGKKMGQLKKAIKKYIEMFQGLHFLDVGDLSALDTGLGMMVKVRKDMSGHMVIYAEEINRTIGKSKGKRKIDLSTLPMDVTNDGD